LKQLQVQFQPKHHTSLNGTTWETKSIASLGWKQSAVQPLLDYLQLKNTKSFIILVNGRIVLENYFNGHANAFGTGQVLEKH
jgi:hypothetical protein